MRLRKYHIIHDDHTKTQTTKNKNLHQSRNFFSKYKSPLHCKNSFEIGDFCNFSPIYRSDMVLIVSKSLRKRYKSLRSFGFRRRAGRPPTQEQSSATCHLPPLRQFYTNYIKRMPLLCIFQWMLPDQR